VAAQNLADATRASSERRGELSRDRDLALAYDQIWWDRGTSTGRTSLSNEASSPPSDHQMIVSICVPGMSCRLSCASHHLASCSGGGGSPTNSLGSPVMS